MSSQAHKLYNELHNAKDEADRNANNTWTEDRRWFEGKVAGYDHALKSLERIFGEQERDNETH